MAERLVELAKIAERYQSAVVEFKSIRENLEALFSDSPEAKGVEGQLEIDTMSNRMNTSPKKPVVKTILRIEKVGTFQDLNKDGLRVTLTTDVIDGKAYQLDQIVVPTYESGLPDNVMEVGTNDTLLEVNRILKSKTSAPKMKPIQEVVAAR